MMVAKNRKSVFTVLFDIVKRGDNLPLQRRKIWIFLGHEDRTDAHAQRNLQVEANGIFGDD